MRLLWDGPSWEADLAEENGRLYLAQVFFQCFLSIGHLLDAFVESRVDSLALSEQVLVGLFQDTIDDATECGGGYVLLFGFLDVIIRNVLPL